MHLLKKFFLLSIVFLISCGSGGALTPTESFNALRAAVEKNDSEAVVNYLTESSLVKINRHNQILKDMRSEQLSFLSNKYGYTIDKLKSLKVSDAVSLYFFSDVTGVRLSRYFKENVVSIDIRGSKALVKTESGVELDFLREGPYWKFDMSSL